MTLEDYPAAASAGHWASTLDRLAENVDELADDFLVRLAELGSYRYAEVAHEDLRQTARDTLEMLILNLSGIPLRPEQRDLPARLGVRRARQGVARENLLEAVRLDFRVLWSGLVRASAGHPADTIVRHAETVLSVVERYIGDVQVAFLDEQAALLRDRSVDANRALARLIAAPEPTAALAEEVGRLARVEPRGRFEVAFVPAAGREGAQRRLEALSTRREHLEWENSAGLALVRPARPEGAGWLAELRGVSGGYVGAVPGLAAVPGAIATARTLAGISERYPGRLVDEDEVWLDVAHDAVRERLPEFARSLRERLGEIDPDDREVMLQTVRAFARTGSIKDTAAALFCHRNTVVNRLRGFARITGLDMTIPEEATRALLSLGPAEPRPEG